jgi:hypothetical protein
VPIAGSRLEESQHIVFNKMVHVCRIIPIFKVRVVARIAPNQRMKIVAGLPCFSGPVRRSLLCAKTLAGREGGGAQYCNVDRVSDLVSISQKAKSRLVWDEMVMADIA